MEHEQQAPSQKGPEEPCQKTVLSEIEAGKQPLFASTGPPRGEKVLLLLITWCERPLYGARAAGSNLGEMDLRTTGGHAQ